MANSTATQRRVWPAAPTARYQHYGDGGREPWSRRAGIVATPLSPADLTEAALRALPAEVTDLEVRADLLGDRDPGWLRRHFRGRLIYSLRSTVHGGSCTNPPEVRRARLFAAERGYDIVDLEAPGDLRPEVLDAIPAGRRRISAWNAGSDLAGQRALLAAMTAVPAKLYVLAAPANSFDEALLPLRLLGGARRRDVTAFATGPQAGWSRILAPWLGAPVVFCRMGEAEADGLPTAEQLVRDFGFPALPRLHGVFGIVARATKTSAFLRQFNAAAVHGLFLNFPVPDEDSFHGRLWPGLCAGGLDELGLPLRGLTVAAPYKAAAITAADTIGPAARRAEAANLLLKRQNRWWATTTDGTAAVAALRAANVHIRQPVAVIGCGGAGRAVATALDAAGAKVTLVNRGAERARYASRLTGLPCTPLTDFAPERYPVVVHATSLVDGPPFALDRLADDATVVDFICAAEPTPLISAARRRGMPTVDGHQILEQELSQQYALMTGRPFIKAGE